MTPNKILYIKPSFCPFFFFIQNQIFKEFFTFFYINRKERSSNPPGFQLFHSFQPIIYLLPPLSNESYIVSTILIKPTTTKKVYNDLSNHSICCTPPN